MKPKSVLVTNTENPNHNCSPAKTLKRFHHCRPPLLTLREFSVPARNNVSNSNQRAEGTSKKDVIHLDCSQRIDESRDRTSHEELSNGHVTQTQPSLLILHYRNITKQRGDFINERFDDCKSVPSKSKLSQKPKGIEAFNRKGPLCAWVPPDSSSPVSSRRGDWTEEWYIDAKKYFDKSKSPLKPQLHHKPKGKEVFKRKGPLSAWVPPAEPIFITGRPGENCRLEESFIEFKKYLDKPNSKLPNKPKRIEAFNRKDPLSAGIPYYDKTKLTVAVTSRPGDCRLKEWFIEATKFFEKPNLKLPDKQSGTEKSPKKITKRKCPLRALRNVYADYLYDDDYIQSNYYYILEMEKQYTLRKSYFEQKFTMVDRQMVVNWIVHITEKLYLEESTMFSAIRMFDTFLVRSRKVEPEHYYLNAVTCLWISSKLVDRTTHAVKVYNATAKKFNKAQLVAAERKILWQLKFDVNYPEPLIILNYYLRRQCLQNNNNVRYAALFLLECFMLLSEFSSSSPSLLAAAALFLTYLKLGMLVQASLFKNFIEDHILPKELVVKYSLALFNLVTQQVFCCRSILWNSIEKYSSPDKLKVAEIFISIS